MRITKIHDTKPMGVDLHSFALYLQRLLDEGRQDFADALVAGSGVSVDDRPISTASEFIDAALVIAVA